MLANVFESPYLGRFREDLHTQGCDHHFIKRGGFYVCDKCGLVDGERTFYFSPSEFLSESKMVPDFPGSYSTYGRHISFLLSRNYYRQSWSLIQNRIDKFYRRLRLRISQYPDVDPERVVMFARGFVRYLYKIPKRKPGYWLYALVEFIFYVYLKRSSYPIKRYNINRRYLTLVWKEFPQIYAEVTNWERGRRFKNFFDMERLSFFLVGRGISPTRAYSIIEAFGNFILVSAPRDEWTLDLASGSFRNRKAFIIGVYGREVWEEFRRVKGRRNRVERYLEMVVEKCRKFMKGPVLSYLRSSKII